MSSGIYVLFYETNDGQYYIGKSIGLEGRYEDHCKKLKNNSHHNNQLQRLYNLYKYFPSIYILEVLPSDDTILNSREIYWISKFNSFIDGMNETIGGEGVGFGENHPNAKLSDTMYYSILYTLATSTSSISEIASVLNVPRSIVSSISSGATHRWLSSVFPEEYKNMLLRVKKTSGCNDLAARGISYPPIISPDGIIYSVTNIRAFAREHNLSNQDLGKVLRGDRPSTKGWKLHT